MGYVFGSDFTMGSNTIDHFENQNTDWEERFLLVNGKLHLVNVCHGYSTNDRFP